MGIKIAISGKAGAGKNQVLEFAKELWPQLQFHEEKFAKFVYSTVKVIHGVLGLRNYKDGKLMQFLGLHMRETHGDNFWIDRLNEHLKACNNVNIVVTDLRFPNELEYCKKNNFYIIRVKRYEDLRKESMVGRSSIHESETALDKTSDEEFDYVLENNGTLEELKLKLTGVLNEIIRHNQVFGDIATEC